MKIDNNAIRFSSGRQWYANRGIIGLAKESDGHWAVTEGYEGGLHDDLLTPVEKIELGDYMIGLWQEFRQDALDKDNIRRFKPTFNSAAQAEQIDILIGNVQALKSDVGYLLHLAGNNLRESMSDQTRA